MYAKCGVPAKAQEVLEELPTRNVISWNALLAGYVDNELNENIVCLFHQMQLEGVAPDVVTYVNLLKAFQFMKDINMGREVHNKIVICGLEHDMFVGSSIVSMYTKCGMLSKAQQVLEELPIRDVVSWNALLGGYAQQGQGCKALCCIAQMETEGICPDDITLLCVVNACGHSGKLDEAQTYYETMSRKYGITPSLEHHVCMVVVFGCAGCLDKAMSVIKTMPYLDDSSVWLALLVSCKKWRKVELARLAFDKAIQLDNHLALAYVLMANIYAAAGMYEDEQKVEVMRINNCLLSEG